MVSPQTINSNSDTIRSEEKQMSIKVDRKKTLKDYAITTRTRDADEQPYGTPYNPKNMKDAIYMAKIDPASMAHIKVKSAPKLTQAQINRASRRAKRQRMWSQGY